MNTIQQHHIMESLLPCVRGVQDNPKTVVCLFKNGDYVRQGFGDALFFFSLTGIGKYHKWSLEFPNQAKILVREEKDTPPSEPFELICCNTAKAKKWIELAKETTCFQDYTPSEYVGV